MQSVQDKRIEILMQALAERYAALHKIRERAQSIGVWTIGLSSAASAWLLQSAVSLSLITRVFLMLGVLVASYGIRVVYLADLERGFTSQMRVAARIEEALGLYTANVLDEGGTSIYPLNWNIANGPNTHITGGFFRATYTLLYMSAGFLLISIMLSASLTPLHT